MQVCLVDADAALARRELLGLTLAQRAALIAQAAGATRVFCAPPALPALRVLVDDGRLRLAVLADTELSVAEESLLLRADALCSAEALRALPSGRHLTGADGVPLAARARLAPGQAAAERLSQAAHEQPAVHDPSALLVSNEASFVRARRTLLAGLIKPSDGPVSRHLNRHLSRAITRLVLPLGMTPNQMTVLVAACGAAAAVCAAQPSYRAQLLGGALFQLHSVLDGCDGELARLTHRFGKHGALIDSLVDDASNLAFFFALSLGVARALGADWPLAAGAVSVACYLGVAVVQYRVVLRATGKGEKTAFWVDGSARRSPLFSLLHALGRRDVFVLVILVALALGLGPWVVAALPAMAVGALVTSVARARDL